jgi:hypothetical protein
MVCGLVRHPDLPADDPDAVRPSVGGGSTVRRVQVSRRDLASETQERKQQAFDLPMKIGRLFDNVTAYLLVKMNFFLNRDRFPLKTVS